MLLFSADDVVAGQRSCAIDELLLPLYLGGYADGVFSPGSFLNTIAHLTLPVTLQSKSQLYRKNKLIMLNTSWCAMTLYKDI